MAASVSVALVMSGTPTIGFADEAVLEQGEETPAVVENEEPSETPSQDNGGTEQPSEGGETPSTPQPPADETPDQGADQGQDQEQPQVPDQQQGQGNGTAGGQGNASQGGTSDNATSGSSKGTSTSDTSISSSIDTSLDSDDTIDKRGATNGSLRADSSTYGSCSATARLLAKQRLGLDLTGTLIVSNYSALSSCCNGEFNVGKTPKKNSLAVWAPGGANSSGHVAFVNEVSEDGTRMHITEGGYHPNGDFSSPGQLHEAWVATSGSEYGYQYGGDLVGFIYLEEPKDGRLVGTLGGTLDSATGGEGTITVAGTTRFSNVSSDTVKVQFYDGTISSGSKLGSLTADATGTFKKKLTVARRGSFTLYAYVVDGSSSNTTYQLSGTYKIKVTEPKGDAITTLAEGAYAIRSRLKSSMSLDIQKASKSNTANAMVYRWSGKANQIYNVIKNSDGTYSLIANHSGKAIEVRGCSVEPGANVCQYTSNGGDNQKWWLDKNTNGTYTLRNKLSGQVLEVNGSTANNGTNVRQNTGKDWKRQMWYFVPVSVSKWSIKASSVDVAGEVTGPVTTTVTVKAGNVTLTEGVDYTLAYQNNASVGTAAVTIIGLNGFTGVKTTTFSISDSTQDVQASSKPSWKGPSSIPVGSICFFKVNNGTMKIKSGSSLVGIKDSYLRAKKAGTVTLALMDSDGNEVATKTLKVVELKGTYEIQTALNSKYVLDIQKGSKENSANMIVYTRTNKKNQHFEFERQSNGTYAIKCVHSGKYVDVQGGGTEEGNNVIQYTYSGKPNQCWLIQVDANGRVTFCSAKSGLCFNVNGGKAVKGRKINQWSATGGKSQKWVLNQV